MRLKSLNLKNFRCYCELTKIDFEDMTTFIGKNDIGKSTILEALEIFFNNDTVKIDPSDCNIYSASRLVEITCDFEDLPKDIILDSGASTSLFQEHLLAGPNLLRIKKVYDCSKLKVSCEIYICAKHPTKKGYDDLLSKKEAELQKLVKKIDSKGPQKNNPKMRKFIWDSTDDLELKLVDIPVSKAKEDAKSIWSKIDAYLPNYALFQSDRNSQDSDGEVQNPMKAAIQEAISEVQDDINDIQEKIREKAEAIANETYDALKSIDPQLASQLMPRFSSPAASKWNSLYSISMDTDEGIALNKRGSGVRRMILVGFFKAEAERKAKSTQKKNIIYAIEEPETAQHPNNQKILIDSFLKLSQNENCQVILTTHSPGLAQELPVDSIRFIDRTEEGLPIIKQGTDEVFQEVVKTLGVFANIEKDDKVKVLVCVEGPTDVTALKSFSRCLRSKDDSVIDLENDSRVVVIPLGGSILKYWVELRYLNKLHVPAVHIYDNDVSKYQHYVDEVNARRDGSWATLTHRYEIENYLHSDAIKELYEVDVDTSSPKVPENFAKVYSEKMGFDGTMKAKTAKLYLSKVFKSTMTYEYLEDMGVVEEIKGWFNKIGCLANK